MCRRVSDAATRLAENEVFSSLFLAAYAITNEDYSSAHALIEGALEDTQDRPRK